MTKPTKRPVRPAKTQISLGIWVDAGRTGHFVDFVMRRLILKTDSVDVEHHK